MPRIEDEQCHTQTHIQLETISPLTARSSSLRCVSAAKLHTAEQYFKTGRKKIRKHLPRSSLSWNTRQDLIKIPYSLCAAALETEQRCFSKIHLSETLLLQLYRPGMAQKPINKSGVICITDQLAFQTEKKQKCIGGTITGPKHGPAALLNQPQTVYSDNHSP